MIIYVPLFLFSRGNIVFREDNDNRVHWEWHFPAQPLQTSSDQNSKAEDNEGLQVDLDEQQALRSQAWKLLL